LLSGLVTAEKREKRRTSTNAGGDVSHDEEKRGGFLAFALPVTISKRVVYCQKKGGTKPRARKTPQDKKKQH